MESAALHAHFWKLIILILGPEGAHRATPQTSDSDAVATIYGQRVRAMEKRRWEPSFGSDESDAFPFTALSEWHLSPSFFAAATISPESTKSLPAISACRRSGPGPTRSRLLPLPSDLISSVGMSPPQLIGDHGHELRQLRIILNQYHLPIMG